MLSFICRWKKVTPPITFFTTLLLFSQVTLASDNNAEIEKINQRIQNKLDFYNKAFPEIQFVHLKNGEWEKSLQALELFIGYQPTNLDYEHPADLREELLFVTIEKIRLMLINKITSSYLFKVGQTPAATRKNVCVITLDPATTVLNNKVATRYLLDLPDKIVNAIPEERYINKEHHLEFILDHEAFHCLDTFNYGGIPMSDKEYSTRYDSFKRESQADMFAVAMHLNRHHTQTPCINNMMMMRGMTLLNGEPQHNSIEAIKLVIDNAQDNLGNKKPEQIFKIVKQLYKEISPSYDEYINYRVAAVSAIKQLGKQVNENKEPFFPKNAIPDKAMVAKLVKQTQSYYQLYTGETYSFPGK